FNMGSSEGGIDMVICPSCKSFNVDGSATCYVCHTPLDTKTSTSVQVIQTNYPCPFCLSPMSFITTYGRYYCYKCGRYPYDTLHNTLNTGIDSLKKTFNTIMPSKQSAGVNGSTQKVDRVNTPSTSAATQSTSSQQPPPPVVRKGPSQTSSAGAAGPMYSPAYIPSYAIPFGMGAVSPAEIRSIYYCKQCNTALNYLYTYSSWFCPTCNIPVPQGQWIEKTFPCKTCGDTLAYITQYGRWYCYRCNKYTGTSSSSSSSSPSSPSSSPPPSQLPVYPSSSTPRPPVVIAYPASSIPNTVPAGISVENPLKGSGMQTGASAEVQQKPAAVAAPAASSEEPPPPDSEHTLPSRYADVSEELPPPPDILEEEKQAATRDTEEAEEEAESSRKGPVIVSAVKETKITNVFIVYHDGRLIFSWPEKGEAGFDTDIMSSMLTAVQMFIADSFKDQTGMLSSMRYGNLEIRIERGVQMYMAVVISGPIPKGIKKSMRESLIEIRKANPWIMKRKWDGDTGQFVNIRNIVEKQILQKYVKKDSETDGKKEGEGEEKDSSEDSFIWEPEKIKEEIERLGRIVSKLEECVGADELEDIKQKLKFARNYMNSKNYEKSTKFCIEVSMLINEVKKDNNIEW
ncbi:MAG: hypothetical protein QW728_04905, partial [Thermoplasmata archaeon]